jgi:hypothetical protein
VPRYHSEAGSGNNNSLAAVILAKLDQSVKDVVRIAATGKEFELAEKAASEMITSLAKSKRSPA